MKPYKIPVLGVASLIMAFAMSTPVQAKTWYKITPQAIRGNYGTKLVKTTKSLPYNTAYMKKIICISKNSMPIFNYGVKTDRKNFSGYFSEVNDGIINVKKYNYIGKNTYKISGLSQSGSSMTVYVRKYANNKIRYTFSGSFKNHSYMYEY